jgi:NADH-quinone oxidoreductase subunit J
MIPQIIFWLLAAGAIFASALVVLPAGARNPLYGALSLVLSFFFVAGLYVLLLAHTMAVLQILVYAGAIMVLFIFVIMLLNLSPSELGDEKRTFAKWLGGAATVAIGVQLTTVVERASNSVTAQPLSNDFGTVDAIGDALFRDYLVPFELTGVLLLVAVVGAVILAKRSLS